MQTPNRLDSAVERLKNMPIPQGPSTELKQKTLAQMETAGRGGLPSRPSPWDRLQAVGRLGLAAALLVYLGFLGGRRAAPRPLDEQQWQQLRHSLLESLEPTLRTQIEETLSDDWQKTLVFTYTKLMNEVDEQVDQKLNQYAMQVLTVSHANTEQALKNLMELIRQNETRQQARITNALDQIEYDRLISDSQFRTSLAHFAKVTQNHLQHTEDLIKYVAHEQGSASDPNAFEPSPNSY
jgi:hypothetical protein